MDWLRPRVSPVPRYASRSLVLVLLIAPLVPPAAHAQIAESTPVEAVLQAIPLGDQQMRIDGALDEPIWRTGQPARNFLQREPDNGAPSTERTEVRVVFDSRRLIIGAHLWDSEPDRILGNQMQRDEGFGADDRFIVTIDPFLNHLTGYVFQTNPLGSLQDGLVSATTDNDAQQRNFGGGINRSWDGIWTVRTRRVSDGWTLEMEIPFATLNFDPNLTTWGINFQRTIRRKAEESVWSGFRRNEGVAHMASAGRLTGLSGLSQGLGLDVKPFIVGRVSRNPGQGLDGAVSTGDVGGDLFYNLTPALRANLSVNTDFAETEVDNRQVNLTQFPLFFDEKREFFLQGSGYFEFGREAGNAVTPFFSRSIGLDADGVPQPINVGAKLTGQAGPYDVGFLHVRTADTASQSGEDFTVGRVRRRLLRESYVGALMTRRTGPDDVGTPRYTVGADAVLRTSRFAGAKTVEWSGWWLYTSNPAGTGQNIGRGSRLSFPNDPFYFDLSYRELQSNYDPAVGYLQRVGFRRYNPQVGYAWRFAGNRWFQAIQHEIDWERLYDMDNRLLAEVVALKPVTIRFSEGSSFSYEIRPSYERLEKDFEISRGIVLPEGSDYRFTRHRLEGQMSNRYPVALQGRIELGTFYSGTSAEYQTTVRVRPRPGLAFEFRGQHNDVALAEGSFRTNVFRFVTNTQFSPWLSVVNNLQYDDVSRALGWQLRFRWIQRPGNDLFLVYGHNWQQIDGLDGRRFESFNSRLSSKFVYTWRF